MYLNRRFILALAAAPLAWLILYRWLQPPLDLTWPARMPLRYLLPALVYPIVEELVFRGALQSSLRERACNLRTWHGLTLANLYTSFIFTALHFLNHPPLWAAAVFIPSLIFGYFRDRHNSLTPGILLHVFYNAGFFLIFQ